VPRPRFWVCAVWNTRDQMHEATLRSPEDALGAFVLGEAPGKYEGFLTGTPELIPRLPR
jgi:hypothetical protein